MGVGVCLDEGTRTDREEKKKEKFTLLVISCTSILRPYISSDFEFLTPKRKHRSFSFHQGLSTENDRSTSTDPTLQKDDLVSDRVSNGRSLSPTVFVLVRH